MTSAATTTAVPIQATAAAPGAGAAAPSGAPATPAAASSAGTQQAAAGAAQAQPKAEAFNAPALDLPDDPDTRDVLRGLTAAMADPTVNDTSAQRLYELHQQLLEAEKAMTQAVLDGMR